MGRGPHPWPPKIGGHTVEASTFKMFEGLLIIGAVVAFAIWQFGSLRRDREERDRRRAEEQKTSNHSKHD
ncbi:hypothetical protein SAMN05421693_11964 [Ectothiorhodospira magna]|uniref:Uncharacterized protein n=1 Tax=Ectothiorhodospira magna TaxID=867345 RepID=A0A1H9E1X6_9GAMM|nr:hypothetical protein SAMN05421693_11964 [Ectothiorhodospira magna]